MSENQSARSSLLGSCPRLVLGFVACVVIAVGCSGSDGTNAGGGGVFGAARGGAAALGSSGATAVGGAAMAYAGASALNAAGQAPGNGGSSGDLLVGPGGASSIGGTTAAGGATSTGGNTSAAGSNAKGGSYSAGGAPAGGATSGASGSTSMAGTASTAGSSGTACGAGLKANVIVGSAAELEAAFGNAKTGDVISIAAGNYSVTGKSFKLSVNNVKIFGAAGKTILDYHATATTDSQYGLDISGSSNSICGLTFARAADNGIHITGDGNTIERCEFYGCFDSGLQISGPEAETTPHPAKNLILNCDSHDNYDTKASGGNADGFASKINIGPGNRFFGCVAHDNSDDGWDTFPKTASGTNSVTVENCVAYHNGYHNGTLAGNGNGFKVGSDQTGGAAHVLKNCVAFDNPAKGFDQNHNQGVATIQNSTALDNDRNVAFQEYQGANITNTVANGEWKQAGGTDSGNVKDAATSAFTNLSPSSLTRDADGTLHLNGFCSYKPSTAGAHF